MKKQVKIFLGTFLLLFFLLFVSRLEKLNITNMNAQELDLELENNKIGFFPELSKDDIQSIEISFFGCGNKETSYFTKKDKEKIIDFFNLISREKLEKLEELEEYYIGGGTSLCLEYKDNDFDNIYINFIGGNLVQYEDSYFKIEENDIKNINTILAKY